MLKIVKGEQVRDQMIVFDELALLVAHILGNHAVAAEGHPLHKMVKALASGRGGLDGVAQLPIREITEQKHGAHNASQFS